jgi:hypothetical protein
MTKNMSTMWEYEQPTSDALDPRWADRSLCGRGETDPQWFELTGDRYLTKANLIALSYCARCPVDRECGIAARAENSDGTIRGHNWRELNWRHGR